MLSLFKGEQTDLIIGMKSAVFLAHGCNLLVLLYFERKRKGKRKEKGFGVEERRDSAVSVRDLHLLCRRELGKGVAQREWAAAAHYSTVCMS